MYKFYENKCIQQIIMSIVKRVECIPLI